MQPNQAFQEALKEETVAKTIGTAAVDRLRPLFKEFGDQAQVKTFIALVMQIASAVARNGQSPDIISRIRMIHSQELALGNAKMVPMALYARKFSKLLRAVPHNLLLEISRAGCRR